ncbi:MAG: RsbRD N-terminal domain-containing protein [Desulfobacteraceae bacterium]|uniref:RsbRD N-terminal domain-containing protein n=1 Tax=Candidatus Desulfaltia bathyphila TaxID=2841697 RepID=A0A8J6N639_9BACT|nr:RsbRD N-terminal domain-containing protein [Candidatus Desulfaltia bathyphila]
MRLNDLLKQKKAAIVKEWFNMVIDTYPLDTSRFLKKQKDPFANPVGNTISQGLGPLFDELVMEMDPDAITTFLDPIIRIRAVQVMFSPSQAVAFIFSLKEAVRKNLKKELNDNKTLNELLLFESKIDEIGLMAFDIFMKCREQIYNLKAYDERNRTFRAFKRAGLVAEIPDGKPDAVINFLKSSNTAVEPLDDR